MTRNEAMDLVVLFAECEKVTFTHNCNPDVEYEVVGTCCVQINGVWEYGIRYRATGNYLSPDYVRAVSDCSNLIITSVIRN